MIAGSARQAEASALMLTARRVRSGDPDNLEAQAARERWSALVSADIPRDLNAGGTTAQLNRRYTVVRSCVSKAIITAGLHPAIGLQHQNRLNGFALADDRVELFRPQVGRLVRRMIDEDIMSGTPEAKQGLSQLIGHDLRLGGTISPVSVAIQRLAPLRARRFEERESALAIED
ncbi:CRISPR-associated endonuclease Cas1 [Novosphingobium subterraneum]|uniref:CRISPR-associated endonuclease Cas1 n=1 Tax=Novosphingobium subterraneum TaxID=48936 RepID=UPI003D043F4C